MTAEAASTRTGQGVAGCAGRWKVRSAVTLSFAEPPLKQRLLAAIRH